MTTYLLTWNPARWQWEDMEEWIKEIEQEGYSEKSWSCGVTRKIHHDDRIFLIKLGAEPRGIVASGRAVDIVYKGQHWDEQSRIKGKSALYIRVRFDRILNPERVIFSRARLSEGIYTKMHWEPQASGVTIPDNVAEQLEKDWAQFLNDFDDRGFASGVGGEQLEKDWAQFLNQTTFFKEINYPDEIEDKITYNEGAKKQITVNAYERNKEAREKCIQHHGLNCSVCGFNFEENYGEIGRGYIHVHHLKPLSEIGENYEINSITDLRPVCPNCHAMIHRRSPAYTIDELRAILRKKKNAL